MATIVSALEGNSATSPIDTGSFTVGAQSGRLIGVVVSIVATGGAPSASAAFDPTGSNQALTEIGAPTSAGGSFYIASYALTNPTAATGVVRVSITPVGSLLAAWVRGVFASSAGSASDFTTASGTSTAPSVTVPNAATDDLVIDAFVGPQETYTVGAAQTRIGTDTNLSIFKGGGSSQSGTDGGVMSWSWSGVSDAWGIGGMRITNGAVADNGLAWIRA